jgi:hypothetical protein
VSWDLALRHLAATRATLVQLQVSIDLALNQVTATEAFARQQRERDTAGQARIELPTTCASYLDGDCGLQSPESVIENRNGDRMCRGCAAQLT